MERLHRRKCCEKCSLQEVTMSHFKVVALSRTAPWDSVGDVISSFIEELTQRRRQRQRGREKSNRFRLAKQQFYKCITLFVHFFAVAARLQRENAYFHVLSRTWTEDNNFLFLFLIFHTESFRIQLPKIWRIKRDGVSAIKFETTRIQFTF